MRVDGGRVVFCKQSAERLQAWIVVLVPGCDTVDVERVNGSPLIKAHHRTQSAMVTLIGATGEGPRPIVRGAVACDDAVPARNTGDTAQCHRAANGNGHSSD